MPNPTRVVFGTTTRVLDIDADEEKVFSIVGADESNIEKNWISCESPLGKSLIGKEIGDVAKSRVPGGEREYEILEISIDYEDDSEGEQAAQ
jgi:transcription elongation factor GreA